MEKNKITVDKTNGLTKTYRIRPAGLSKYKLWEVTIPANVVEREARKRRLSIGEFVERYRVQWLFNDFEGMFLEFIPSDRKQNG